MSFDVGGDVRDLSNENGFVGDPPRSPQSLPAFASFGALERSNIDPVVDDLEHSIGAILAKGLRHVLANCCNPAREFRDTVNQPFVVQPELHRAIITYSLSDVPDVRKAGPLCSQATMDVDRAVGRYDIDGQIPKDLLERTCCPDAKTRRFLRQRV